MFHSQNASPSLSSNVFPSALYLFPFTVGKLLLKWLRGFCSLIIGEIAFIREVVRGKLPQASMVIEYFSLSGKVFEGEI